MRREETIRKAMQAWERIFKTCEAGSEKETIARCLLSFAIWVREGGNMSFAVTMFEDDKDHAVILAQAGILERRKKT